MQRRRMALFSFSIFLICVTPAAWSADVSILRAEIEKLIPRAGGGVGVAIKHIESGTELMINADEKLKAVFGGPERVVAQPVQQRDNGFGFVKHGGEMLVRQPPFIDRCALQTNVFQVNVPRI